MTKRRQNAAIVVFSLVFWNPIAQELTTASALASKVNKRQLKRQDFHEKNDDNNKFLRHPLSDTIIHVGNIDWKVPINDVSDMITQVIMADNEGKSKTNRFDGDNNSFEVKVAELPVTKRKRDEGKFHQGSAKVSFSSAGEASQAMESFLRYSEQASSKSGNAWTIRWAFVPPNDRGSLSSERRKEEMMLSPERIEHRKKRAEKYARKRKRVGEATDKAIDSLLERLGSIDRDLLMNPTPVLEAPLLDWKVCPDEIDPMRGGRIRKGTQRGERKRAAVEAFLEVVLELVVALTTEPYDNKNDKNTSADRSRRTIADLGCGAGNLTVPLAWWLKQFGFDVLGVDINDQALSLLSKRAEKLGVGIRTLHTDLLKLSSFNDQDSGAFCVDMKEDEYPSTSSAFDGLSDCAAVVSLHACGAASDLSMAAAVRYKLPFAISPCCIGKISTERGFAGKMLPKSLTSAERSGAPTVVSYPRSTWLSEALPNPGDYRLLAAAADYGVGNSSNEQVDEHELARRKRCKLSKKIIEIDRLQWAKENGYCIRLLEMPRIGPLYPKRELLLGAMEGSHAALKLLQLPAVV